MKEYQYGSGVCLQPKIPGRRDSPHMNQIFLPKLLPLEEYDKIIVLFSGGKDSLACVLDLLERGVPKERIELWHHDIDGGHPIRRMDWPVTQSYVKAVAQYLGLTLRTSWRVNGFWGEVYRIGASWPIQYVEPATGTVHECRLSAKQIRSDHLREKILDAAEQVEMENMGCRMKFPAKSGNLATRWCSSILKIMVADTVTLFEMIQVPEFYDELNSLLQEFNVAHDYQWQAAWNGRSGGYLVLYQGEKVPSSYRSFCTKCGQKNFTSVSKTGHRCGVCGEEARRDFITPPFEVSVFPGRSIDKDEDFSEWSMRELQQRTALVQEFDKLADAIVSKAVYMAHTYKVVEEIEYVPVTQLRLA